MISRAMAFLLGALMAGAVVSTVAATSPDRVLER